MPITATPRPGSVGPTAKSLYVTPAEATNSIALIDISTKDRRRSDPSLALGRSRWPWRKIQAALLLATKAAIQSRSSIDYRPTDRRDRRGPSSGVCRHQRGRVACRRSHFLPQWRGHGPRSGAEVSILDTCRAGAKSPGVKLPPGSTMAGGVRSTRTEMGLCRPCSWTFRPSDHTTGRGLVHTSALSVIDLAAGVRLATCCWIV